MQMFLQPGRMGTALDPVKRTFCIKATSWEPEKEFCGWLPWCSLFIIKLFYSGQMNIHCHCCTDRTSQPGQKEGLAKGAGPELDVTGQHPSAVKKATGAVHHGGITGSSGLLARLILLQGLLRDRDPLFCFSSVFPAQLKFYCSVSEGYSGKSIGNGILLFIIFV